jgi:tetratricopeptide (TPR) repeat protein
VSGQEAHAQEPMSAGSTPAGLDVAERLHRIPPVHVFWAATGLLFVSAFVAFATLRGKPIESEAKSADAAAALERTTSLAWAAYQRGRFLTFKHHVLEGTHAIAEFNRALELDPSMAEAWNGLAGVYISMAMFSVRDPLELERKARDAAQRAQALRPDLAETHVITGRIAYVFDWNWDAAEAAYKRALEIDPTNTSALLWLGMLDANLGRVELGVERLERAAALDPASLQIGSFLCKNYVLAREYDHAVEQCRQDLVLDSTSQISTDWLAYAYELRGDHDLAVQTYLDFARAVRDPEFAQEIESFRGKRGLIPLRVKWARDELEAVASGAPDADTSPARLAWLRLWLGETHEVGPLLQQAYDQRDFFLVWLAMKPETAALAHDPTYRALRARMGLPPLNAAPEMVVWARRFAAVAG